MFNNDAIKKMVNAVDAVNIALQITVKAPRLRAGVKIMLPVKL